MATNTGILVAGSSATVAYGGANQYQAQQTANANRQHSIRKSVSEGYLKTNTLFPSTWIIGHMNIRFEKADGAILNIPIIARCTSSTDVIKGNSFKGHSNMALLLLQSDFIKI